MIFNADQFNNKDVIFVGVGKGRALAGLQTFLESNTSLKSFIGVDKQSSDKPLDFLLEYPASNTVFIKNEGIPGTEMPVQYITPMQLFFAITRASNYITVGITGTKGKSTTTALTAHILQTAGKPVVLAGNIGVSPWEALETATTETIFILELSSYQLSDLEVSPHISACINLYNDHADWHGSLQNYWEAKHNIMRFAGPEDVFIYNPDFPALREWAQSATCQTIPIDSLAALDLSSAQLYGDHNRLNALVAQAIARQFDIPDETSLQAIQSFIPLRHRMQTVAFKNGVTYVDDAIGMTPESTMASLRAITAKIGPISCLLLGGQDRGYDFTALMELVAELQIPYLLLFPETEAAMQQSMPEGYTPIQYKTTSMQEAVSYAGEHATEGSVVLLSTAAPSYILWKDFEDKGDQFQAAVTTL